MKARLIRPTWMRCLKIFDVDWTLIGPARDALRYFITELKKPGVHIKYLHMGERNCWDAYPYRRDKSASKILFFAHTINFSKTILLNYPPRYTEGSPNPRLEIRVQNCLMGNGLPKRKRKMKEKRVFPRSKYYGQEKNILNRP